MRSDFTVFTVPNAPPGGGSTDFARSRQIQMEQSRALEKEKRDALQRLRYLDLNMQCNQVQNKDAIRQSIKNILLTDVRERVMLPEFGSGIKEYLFQTMDAQKANALAGRITNLLNKWEPRIAVYRNQIFITFYAESHLLKITIPYVILTDGIKDTFETVIGI